MQAWYHFKELFQGLNTMLCNFAHAPIMSFHSGPPASLNYNLRTWINGMLWNLTETTTTLKCVSDPGGTLCIYDSLKISRWTGLRVSVSFCQIVCSTAVFPHTSPLICDCRLPLLLTAACDKNDFLKPLQSCTPEIWTHSQHGFKHTMVLLVLSVKSPHRFHMSRLNYSLFIIPPKYLASMHFITSELLQIYVHRSHVLLITASQNFQP